MARTKQTGLPKPKKTPAAKMNGAKKTPETTQSPAVKSPSLPAELSDKDKQVVKTWLDDPSTEFTVATAPVNRKRKRSGGMQTQGDLFEDRLSVQYEVKPRDKWECLRRYKTFTGMFQVQMWLYQERD